MRDGLILQKLEKGEVFLVERYGNGAIAYVANEDGEAFIKIAKKKVSE